MRAIIKEEVNTQLSQILPQAVSDFANPVIEKNVIDSLEAAVLTRSSSQPKSTYEEAASLSEFELTNILLDKIEESKSHLRADYKKKLYDALFESYNTDKDIFNTYGEVFTLKRSRDDSEKDRDPSAKSDWGMKIRMSSKEAESSKDSRSKEKKSSRTSKDASQSQHKSFGKQHVDSRPPQTWISQVARAKEPRTSFDELMDTSFNFSAFKLEYHLEECSKATTERLDWYNPEGKLYPFDLSKPLPLIRDHRGHQVIPQDFFINNDLEYLKGRDLSKRCSTSVTKTKAATYEFKWIEDLDVYSWKRIIVVTRLTIMKKYDYGHLEEIEVRREDQKLYKFREGVKSYQKKLNLTKPDIFRSNLRNRATYTTYSDPKGVIYKDQNNKNKLMRADELHKFSDGMLDDVRSALKDIAKGIWMEYLPKRKWSGLDK
ncbi:hypothetical protein Tco_0315992 [Tanacetum coccineum]